VELVELVHGRMLDPVKSMSMERRITGVVSSVRIIAGMTKRRMRGGFF